MTAAAFALVALVCVLAACLVVGVRRFTRHEAVATEHGWDDGQRVCVGVCSCGSTRDMGRGSWHPRIHYSVKSLNK